MTMDLVRDLLDKIVVDRNGRELGRVDTIIFEMRDDGPPIVAAFEIGLIAIAERLHPVLGRCARAIELVAGIDGDRPARIPCSKILEVDANVTVDLTASEVASLAFEQRARRLVGSLPGSS